MARGIKPLTRAAVVALVVLGAATPEIAHASAPGGPSWGTLDTQPGRAAAEARAGITQAMFEFSWASFEPSQNRFSASYLATMRWYLQAYRAAGMRVTLGLGLQDPPSWVYSLPDATYVDQHGAHSAEADFVFSQAVRQAAAGYLAKLATAMPLSAFWAIRLTSGGDSEMLYPGGGTYWAFSHSAITGVNLPPGMRPNPYPKWAPGTPGLQPAQVSAWVTWYVGGLDNVTKWQMTTLGRLGFAGYYETVTPGSGIRPDGLSDVERAGLRTTGSTSAGAAWHLYYAKLPVKTRVIAYISSVADGSGGNDSCQAADASLPLTSPVMDSWSATRWISRIATQNHLLVGGENPGYGIPASLDDRYVNRSASGMMATAVRLARTCHFTVFYWAHDIRLWGGTLPFSLYSGSIAPASRTRPPRARPAHARQGPRWQARRQPIEIGPFCLSR